jgi:hypothetical protein
MPKQGILHDYDLMANAEPTAKGNTCVICGSSPVSYQWSDYPGEAMCRECGCPYQLKSGSDKQVAEGNYPYLNIKEKYIPIFKEYYQEKKRFTCFGTTLVGYAPGIREFSEWMDKHHPEMKSE